MDINFCEGEEMIIILFLKIQNVKKINDEITAASLHAQCIWVGAVTTIKETAYTIR